jgi:hypothetical protein
MVINKMQIPYLLQPKKATHRKVEPIVPVVPTQKVQKEVPRIFTYEPAKSKKRK